MRLGLALAVVVSHAFSVVTGDVENEPLLALTGMTLGEHAVNGFFAVSGFLVTMSFLRRGWRDYAIARTLRILPGLVAATLVVALVAGPLLSTLPVADYLRQPAYGASSPARSRPSRATRPCRACSPTIPSPSRWGRSGR